VLVVAVALCDVGTLYYNNNAFSLKMGVFDCTGGVACANFDDQQQTQVRRVSATQLDASHASAFVTE
jgi:hypothetical protein